MDNIREKLVELLREVQYLGGLEEKVADHLIANGVTVQTEARWIYVTGRGMHAEYECDNCREHVCFDEKIGGSIPAYEFCPHCFAKMLPTPPKGE